MRTRRVRALWATALLVALSAPLCAQSRVRATPAGVAVRAGTPTDPSVGAGVDTMRRFLADERPDEAIALGKRLLRRAPANARLRVWYVVSLDQARHWDDLWAFVRHCPSRPADSWRAVECAYELATRPRGWRAGMDTADTYLRAAVTRRPGDAELALLATKLLARRAEFGTRQYGPVLSFLDSGVLQTNGDYDLRAWRAAIRFDAASVSPVDTGAQRLALRELAALRLEQPELVPAYRLAADRLARASPGEALPLLKNALELQPRSVALRKAYWALLARQADMDDAMRRAAVTSDIMTWVAETDSATPALFAASTQLRAIKRSALARQLEDRLLARATRSREADEVLWRRASAWTDSLRALTDSTSAHPGVDSVRLSAIRLRALDAFVLRHSFTSSLTRGNAAADLLNLIRADSSYPAANLLAVARVVRAAPLLQLYHSHGIAAVALAERRVALPEAERWTREGAKELWRELDDMSSLYPSRGEFFAALERWQTVFLVARAVVQTASRHYAAADSTLARAIEMSPGDHDAQYALGRLRLIQHRRDEAEFAFVRGFGGRNALGINESQRELERLYRERHGSLANWDSYLTEIRRRESDTRRTKVLASALANVPQPPSFALRTLDGKVVTSQSLRGKIAIVNFWGTWCGPCVGEMPALQTLYDKYRSDTAIAIVTIARDEIADLRRWMEGRRFDVPTLLDAGYSTKALIQSWPTTWVLDRDGTLRYRLQTSAEQLVEEWSWVIEALRKSGR